MSAETLITGGSLIDGSGSEPQPATDVLLHGDLIVAVGTEAAASASADAVNIDAAGLTVMPGLIDAHVHCTFDDVSSNDELFFHRDAATAALVAGFNLPKLLLAGVTSAFDPDTLFEIGPAVRNAVDAGVIDGPRLTVGVQALLTSVGGTAGRLIPDEGRVGYAVVRQLDRRDGHVDPSPHQGGCGLDQDPCDRPAPGPLGRVPGVDRGGAARRVRHCPRPRHPGRRALPRCHLDPACRPSGGRPDPARARSSTSPAWRRSSSTARRSARPSRSSRTWPTTATRSGPARE